MKTYKRLLAAMAALILCLSMGGFAWAAEAPAVEQGAESPQPSAAVESPAPAAELPEIDFEGKNWDDIMDELLERNQTDREHVTAAYINLVTGEEYFINPDVYKVAASMYKLPLNMYFTDIITKGEYDWEANHPKLSYEEMRDESIINSNNEQSEQLWGFLGGYTQFRELTADFMGTPVEQLELWCINDNMYTAREFANCLKLLYNEAERFPGIIETMEKAEPNRFFNYIDSGVRVAHKFGYYNSGSSANMNDCGIAFTTQPIALVMFTQGVRDGETLLADYCNTMCQYTEYLLRPEPISKESLPSLSESSLTVVEAEVEDEGFPFIACAFALLFLLVGLALIISLCVKHRIRFFWLLLALLVSTFAIVLSIVGMHFGTIYAKPSGDPRQSAAEFMDNICSGSYEAAYDMLLDYSSLGLEIPPQTEAARLAYEALHQSFSYELGADISVDKLNAVQPLRFSYLDLSALESAVVEETPNQLKRIVEKHSMNEIYDENRNYLPEITEQAYINAVATVLEDAESYYTSVDIQLALSYADSRWQVQASPALLKALNGGAGY